MVTFILCALFAALAFCGLMLIRNEVAFRLSNGALSLLHEYNMRAISNKQNMLFDYDLAIRDYDDIMWDFSTWSVNKSFTSSVVNEILSKETL